MLDAFISVGLSLVGIFVAQYALGLWLRLHRVYIPLTKELSQKVRIPEKMLSKQKTERFMSLLIMFLIPLLVPSFSLQWWPLAPYFVGFTVGALMLRGKCGRDESNTQLYFYNYRFYLQNELALYDDPAYAHYMAYRRRSMIEQALDAEEKKQRQAAEKKKKKNKGSD